MLLLGAIGALAQTAAELGGTVRDATGALIPGVTVTITRTDTSTVRTAATNEAGFFVAPLLPPGSYQIRLSKDGFKPVTQTGITLQVGQQARLEITLEVGAVVEEVTITGRAPLLETASAARGQVIDNQKIVELPLNGRDYLQLALLSAGAGRVPAGRQDSFSASGQRAYEVSYQLDGVDNNSMQRASQARRGEVIKPSVDAISEFKVLTNSFSAEYGRAGGGVISVNLKSGTNQFHGSAFHFLRNEAFDAKNFFDPPGEPKPAFKRNQFGFTTGGPVKRDKTFFFGDWESTRIRESDTALLTVPTVPQRSGDFSDLAPGTTIFDPAAYNTQTRQRSPFPGNRIPQARLDSVGAKLGSFYPDPNRPGLARNFNFNPPTPEDITRWDAKFDHNFSANDRLNGRYSHSNNPIPSVASWPGAPWFGSRPFSHTGRASMLGYNRIFTPTLLMEAKAAWNELFTAITSPVDKNLNREIGLRGVELDLPGMAIFNPSGYAALGIGAFNPNYSGSQNRQLIVNFTSIRQKHTLKWGTSLSWLQHFLFNSQQSHGNFGFDGRYTRDPVSLRGGNAIADVLLGTAFQGQTSNWVWTDNRRPYHSFFIQDEWRVSQRLTLTPGLRYEVQPEWTTRYNRGSIVDFTDPAAPRVVLFRDGPRFDRAGVHTDTNDFVPRFGFTYRLLDKTVLRGAYGIYIGNTIGTTVFANNPPFQYSATLTPDPVIPSLFLRDGLPPDLVSARNARNIGFATVDPDRPNPYNQQWNFTIQHQLPGEVLLEVGYVGSSAVKIRRSYDINQPTPAAGAINNRRPVRSLVVPPENIAVGPIAGITYETGNSNQSYNGMQWRVDKRLTNGLSVSGSYVFSKTMSDGQGGASIGTTSNGPQDIRNFRAERALADEHFKHRVVANYVYDLPFFRGRRFLGGWTAAGIFTRSSGLRINLSVQGNPSNTGGTDRPNIVGNWFRGGGERSLGRWFNTAAFDRNAAFTFGNAARNLMGGPPLTNLDFALYKNFQVTEKVRVQFRAEAFNFSNTPEFDRPNAQVGNPAFGQVGGAGRPRNLQFGLKVVF
ncbi:MAG: TonB-dependent receptor [Acidobacteria bacterium]|nr:TonB-dependent receptor [Acidobacteriota bacterium]